jgi:hypothetical protein
VSTEQKHNLDAILRQSAFPPASTSPNCGGAATALDRVGQLLSAHLATAERVTA